MTERERQTKIARALIKMSQLAASLAEIGSEFSKATVQLERLAGEFEQGRYLKEASSETEPPDIGPGPREEVPA